LSRVQYSIGYLGDSFTGQRPNQQYQSTEGKKRYKSKENPAKANNYRIHQHNKERERDVHIQKTQQ